MAERFGDIMRWGRNGNDGNGMDGFKLEIMSFVIFCN